MLLRCIRAGGAYSGHRLWYARQTNDDVCPFCGMGAEHVEHIFWRCRRWNGHREKFLDKFEEPKERCLRQCGILPERGYFKDWWKDLEKQSSEEVHMPKREDGSMEDERWEEDEEGNKWLVVASDGACSNQQFDSRLTELALDSSVEMTTL